MFGLSNLKVLKFVITFTSTELLILALGMVIALTVSLLGIKFFMGYSKKHDFKIIGWYRMLKSMGRYRHVYKESLSYLRILRLSESNRKAIVYGRTAN